METNFKVYLVEIAETIAGVFGKTCAVSTLKTEHKSVYIRSQAGPVISTSKTSYIPLFPGSPVNVGQFP